MDGWLARGLTMPDWAVTITTALIGGLFGAGGFAGFAQVLKARADARLAVESQQDEHTLKLYQSLNASEEVFRKAVLGAYEGEVKARRELEANYRETQKQLTIITLERDDLRNKYDAALDRIRQLEGRVAELEQEHH